MRRGIFIGAAAMLILVLVAAAAGAQTHLSVRHASPDEVVIESSTGDDATLPLASANQAGLMSTKHVEELERARRQVPDDVVVGGHYIEGEQITLYTSFGDTIIIPVQTPVPTLYTVYWGKFTDQTGAQYATAFADDSTADVQVVTTTANQDKTQSATLSGFTTSGAGYSVCAYPTALGGRPTSVMSSGFGGPCGTMNNLTVDKGTAQIDGVEYRIWRSANQLLERWFAIPFTLRFTPGG